MSVNAELCPQCRQQLAPGAGFCLACGASLSNRAALRNGAEASGMPSAASLPGAPWQSSAMPGTVAQHPDQLPGQRPVVRAGAAKRLFSKVVDLVIPGLVSGILGSVGLAALLRNGLPGGTNLGPSQEDVVFALVMTGLGALLAIVYVVAMWIWEARSGNSVGNAVFGIRTTEMEGYAPGAGAVFIRWLILLAPNLVFILLGVLLAFFAPRAVTQLVGAAGSFISFVWFIVTGLSNGWDGRDRLQGWHDKAARTLVFDVRAGRNPVTTQGIAGVHSYPTLDLPAVRPVTSPLAGAAAFAPQNGLPQAHVPVSIPQDAPAVPPVAQAPFAQNPPAPLPPAPFPPVQTMQYTLPEATLDAGPDHGETLLRSHLPSGAAGHGEPALLVFDDGGQVPLDGGVLIGRNPSGREGEEGLRLVALEDPGRSISKTHLLVVPASGGAWVTDRQSTNGSGELLADGSLVRLVPGEARFVRSGSSVKFGDRTFRLNTP
ncbi:MULTISPECIES: RDD family protein [Arthrobacter]|uniref:RDD family protein n=2 Tax=Arthrobacter TaxID=1663 RepID=A0ABU9KR88_9MICC|nr:RDD family protein [Arthrobacter sp. YJM1]MDP5228330.1 RDD family protein [Arthrobacter sp. YJM1]